MMNDDEYVIYLSTDSTDSFTTPACYAWLLLDVPFIYLLSTVGFADYFAMRLFAIVFVIVFVVDLIIYNRHLSMTTVQVLLVLACLHCMYLFYCTIPSFTICTLFYAQVQVLSAILVIYLWKHEA